MKLVKLRCSTGIHDNLIIVLMNVITLLYFLVNVQCVNEDASKQYSILCLDDKCTEKISDGHVHEPTEPENSDYLNINLNDTFDIFGYNKDVYLIRKQSRDGLVSRKSIKILKSLHTPFTQVELNFKNNRISIFVKKKELKEEISENTQSIEQNLNEEKSKNQTNEKQKEDNTNQIDNLSDLDEKEIVVKIDKKIAKNISKIEPIDNELNKINENLVNKLNEGGVINQLNVQKQDKRDYESNDLQKETNEKELEDLKNKNKKELNLDDNHNFNENDFSKINKINELNEDEMDELDDNEDEIIKLNDSETINILSDTQHYGKMNSIESSTTDSPFNNQINQEESYFCTIPPDSQPNEMNFYLDIIRYVLGKLVVDRLPDYVVNFLKIKLLISVHLIVFVLLIGLIWLISYFITFIYQSIDNKTKLKNRLCSAQAELSTIRNELQLFKKSTIQIKQKEFERQRIEFENTIDNLLNEKLKMESELDELKNKIKETSETLIEIKNQKEHLMKDLKEEMLNKTKLELNLNEKLKKLDDEHKSLSVYCADLKNKKQQYELEIEDHAKELTCLNEILDELRSKLEDKDNEIKYLNKMYDELSKEQKSNFDQLDNVKKETNNPNQISQHDLTRLKHEIDKLQKERDEFKSNFETNQLKIIKLEEEINKFDEIKTQLTNEKEDALRYNEYSKKYMREKEDELQVQMQSIKDDFEQTKKLYLNSEKYCSDIWRENQTLKNDLNIIKRDNEQLRKQIIDLTQNNLTKTNVPPPPEMPAAVLQYLRFAASPTSSIQQPQSPSNQSNISEISNYYIQQQQHNSSSMNSPSTHHSITTSPTHSIINLSSHSNSMQQQSMENDVNNSLQTNLRNNHSYVYSNLNKSNQLSTSIYSPTLQSNSSNQNDFMMHNNSANHKPN